MSGHRITMAFGVPRRRKAQASEATPAPPLTRMARATPLLVQAHRFRALLERGEVADLADLARRERLTRARITQILGLTLLAPDIQEQILTLPRAAPGRETVQALWLREVARYSLWREQREAWLARQRGRSASSLTETADGAANPSTGVAHLSSRGR